MIRFSTVLVLSLVFVCQTAHSSLAQEQNSTRKYRVKPSAVASKIGSAVNWETDFADAIANAKETGKPIFWYVPTLPGTFMDRKPVIDRYMLAGPFSWPLIVDGINDSFIPVKAAPSRSQQQKFELVAYKFVEPGFLILNPSENNAFTVTAKVDRISTFSPDWFIELLSNHGCKFPIQDIDPALAETWQKFRTGDYEAAVPAQALSQSAEAQLLSGMIAFRKGDHVTAKQIWKQVPINFPNDPLAWKAAAESEGIGPFSRGFEIHRKLPQRAYRAGVESIGSAAPPNTYDESQLWNASVDFLLGMQRSDGGWRDSDYDFGGTDSLPNVHVAISALCGMALIDAAKQLPDRDKEIYAAIAKTLAFVTDERNINRVDRDEILWAFAYKTRFLARLVSSGRELENELQKAVKDLENVQSRRGHWYHEYNNSWVTATALSALFEASSAGARVNESIIEKGCNALMNDRFQDGSYGYYPRKNTGEAPEGSEETIAAAAGRMPPCDLGLWYWKRLKDADLIAALDASFKYHDKLAVALKYDNHTSTYAYGGFFFWYDMRARSEAISQVKDVEKRKQYFAKQRELLLALPEFDGCFIDSHELGRCYGTAMALLCFGREAKSK